MDYLINFLSDDSFSELLVQFFETSFYTLYLLSVTIGPVVAVFLNVVMTVVGLFVPIEGSFQYDVVPLID